MPTSQAVLKVLSGERYKTITNEVKRYLAGGKRANAREPGHITTAMPGNIVEVLVQLEQVVIAGTPVLITEAMKMETGIQAPVTGKVIAIHVKKGDRVTPGQILLELR